MSVWRYVLVKICIIQKLVMLVIRNPSVHVVQDFPEWYFRTDFNCYPKDCTLKRAKVAEQY